MFTSLLQIFAANALPLPLNSYEPILMERQQTVRLLIAGLLSLSACTFSQPENTQPENIQAEQPAASNSTASTPENSPVASSASPQSATSSANQLKDRPATRTATMSVEGEQSQVTLNRFDNLSLPFTTYIPAQDFTPQLDNADDGKGVKFYFSPTGTSDENAYIHVFFPTDTIAPAAMVEQLLAENGLLASNGWKVLDRPTPPYSWATEQITYQQSAQDIAMGSIFIGADQGKSFLVITHYPAEYADGFEPRAAILLETLEMRD
jgi:hypothetical protein